MNKMILVRFLIFFYFLSFNFVFSQESYNIDWINGRIYSSVSFKVKNDYNFAENRLMAIENAYGKVKMNFYRIFKDMYIAESVSLSTYFDERIDKNRELFSLIDQANLYKVEYPTINSIKLTYYLNIYGKKSLMDILMSERDVFTEDLIGYMDFHYDTKYTGIIIDARGELTSYDGYKVKVKPSIFVTIKDNEGRVVFNQNNIYPEIIHQRGMIRYSYNINETFENIVGKKPYKCVACGTGDQIGSVIVITDNSAKIMLSSEITRKAIQNGNIVIIIDR